MPLSRRCYAVQPEAAVTKVEKIILDTIKTTGPISFATYMQMCLSHPTDGYYMNPQNAVFGSKGDFTTSPEISQVFGELVGIWLLSQWLHAGSGRKIRLVELGPGRGTLMRDIFTVFEQFSAAFEALKGIHLVETSPSMRTRQEEMLSGATLRFGWDVKWHGDIADVPRDPSTFTMVVAHEFFDALPFHLIRKTHTGWHEVLLATAVGADAPSSSPFLASDIRPSVFPSTSSHTSSTPRFRPVLSPTPTASSTILGLSSPRLAELPVGSQVEISPAAFKISRRIGELVSGFGDFEESQENNSRRSAGTALIVDYGGEKAYGNSFRAFKDHKIVDVFHRPGECDLTTNVDFAYLKEALSGIATPLGSISQSAFLTRMGLQTRVEMLKQSAKTPERAEEIETAAKRLVDETGMGRQYQLMGVSGRKEAEVGVQERWPFVEEGNKGSA